jgi:chromosome segregation ATPase
MSVDSLHALRRQDLSRLACDALAAAGRKPSIGLVREWTLSSAGIKKGSDGDVQKDINGWFEDLLKLKRDSAVAGLPDAIGSLAREFWRLAIDSADQTLAAEREDMQQQLARAGEGVDQAKHRADAAAARSAALAQELALANATIAGRDEVIAHLEQTLSEARAILHAKEERIAGLGDELGRSAQQHAAGLAELDGLRKHSLLQIDQARGEARHWKSEFERVDHENRTTLESYRQKASSLANDLAGARGRLSAIEEALAAARARNAELEQRMVVTPEEAVTVESKPRTLPAGKRAAGKGMASALRRRQKN